jgi:folylpolyglutamate synthase/dihydropteroate synthase
VARGIRAAQKAAGKNGAVVAFGSLYLAGHIRTVWQQMQDQT